VALATALAACATSPPALIEPAPPAPVAVARPAEPPPPVPTPPPATPPAARRAEVVVLYETDTPGYRTVADELVAQLPAKRYRVSALPFDDASQRLEPFRHRAVTVIAVGLKAVEAARAQLPGKPIVFCQVFGFEPLLETDGPIWGIEPVPPATLQLRNWKAVDPTLRRIAVIVSDAHGSLAEQAVEAGAQMSATVRVLASSSDRETLYLFKRAAPEIDGLWLFPDNRILSPSVLRELLAYAPAHGVGVLTFNEALLPWGGLLSATPVPADIADAVHRVLDRVIAGQTADLPAMTPLSAIELFVNPHVVGELGLPIVSATHWISREPD
jgi:hypothetical protein